MVDISTFLMILASAFSLVAVVVASRALNAVKQRRELPERLAAEVAFYTKQVKALDELTTSHIKKHASEKGAAARAANTGAPVAGRMPDGSFNVDEIDRLLNLKGTNHG